MGHGGLSSERSERMTATIMTAVTVATPWKIE